MSGPIMSTERIRQGFMLGQKDVHCDRAARIAAELKFDQWFEAQVRHIRDGVLRESADRAAVFLVDLPEDGAAAVYMHVRFGEDTGRSEDWDEAYRVVRAARSARK